MSLRYPVIKIAPGAARTALVVAILARGFPKASWRMDQLTGESGEWTHLGNVPTSDSYVILAGGLGGPEMTGWWGVPMVSVNSPAHFLSYLDRMGIKPSVSNAQP